MSILDDRRGELPDLPIDVFPQSMHRWMIDAARGAGVTVGHIALPLIGMASGLIGVARRVQATRSWQQPMTCWTCLVGAVGLGQDAVARRGQARAVCGGAQSATGEHRAPTGARDARRARQGGAQEMEGRRCRRGRCRAAAAGQAGRGAGRAPVRGAAPLRLRLHDRAAGAAARGAAARRDLCGRRARPAVHEPRALQRRFGSRVLARGLGRQQLHRGTPRPPASDIASPSRRRRWRFPAGLAGAQFCRRQRRHL